MLRITVADRPNGLSQVRLEGRLSGPWVDEFEALVRGLGRHTALELDLSAVTFADPAGVSLVRRMVAQGATVGRSSAYLDPLLVPEDS